MANKINYTGSSKVIQRICESLNDVIDNGGGETVVLINKNITQNGTYNAVTDDDANGYREVTVNVPNTYSVSDEGKVVNNGALVSQTSQNISANGTYNTTTNNEVVVSVSNTYTAGDEGKVVDNGALVAQTSRTVTTNGTYDTTENNEVVVNVSGGGGGGTLSGETAPTSAMGSNGDFYIQYQVGVPVGLVPQLSADSNLVLASDVLSGYPKWKAFDGTNINYSDSWAAMRGSIANHYIGYNFDTLTTIDSLMVENRNEGSSRAFKDFTLQGSNDLSTWTDIESFTIDSSAANYISNFNLSNTATYKAFRLYITSYYDSSYVGAGIIQFYLSDPTKKVLKKVYNKQSGTWVEVGENSVIEI